MTADRVVYLWPDAALDRVCWSSPTANGWVTAQSLPAVTRAGAPEEENASLGRVLPEAAVQTFGNHGGRLLLDAGLAEDWQAFPWEWTRDSHGRPWAGRLRVERCVPVEPGPAASGDGFWLVNLWPAAEAVQPFDGQAWVWQTRARAVRPAEKLLCKGLPNQPPPAALALIAHGSETAAGPALLDPAGQPWPAPIPQPAPRLVVIAACAGRDGNLIAEGRRWLAKGARTVLVPLGRLDATATAGFLAAFGQGLADGEAPGALLARLQAEPGQRHGAARFVLLGDGGPADGCAALIALTRQALQTTGGLDDVFEALRRQRHLPGHYADTDAGRALLDELWALEARLPVQTRAWVLALCAWLAERHDHARLDACLLRQGHCRQALPASATPHALWAKVPYRQGNYGGALEELSQALALDRQHAGALGLYANCLLDLDLPEAACTALEQRDDALCDLPADAAIDERHKQHDMIARLRLRRGDLYGADELFRRKQQEAIRRGDSGRRELAWRLYVAAWRTPPDAAGAELAGQARAALDAGPADGHGNEDAHYLLRALAAWAWRCADAALVAQLGAELRRRWQSSRSEGGPLALACGFLHLHDPDAFDADWARARAALESERYFLELAALAHLAGETAPALHLLERFQQRRRQAIGRCGHETPALLRACEQRERVEAEGFGTAGAEPARLVASGLLPL